MQVHATTDGPLQAGADTIAIGVLEGEVAGARLPGDPVRQLLDSGEARPTLGHVAVGHCEGLRLIVVGLGPAADLEPEAARVAAAAVEGRAREIGTHELCFVAPTGARSELVAGIVEGVLLHAYRFDRYRHADRMRELGRLVLSSDQDLSTPVREAAILATAQNRARDLGNTPANDLPPTALADYARELAERHGIAVTVLDEPAIRALGMGAFAAVAQGSEEEARLIRLDYDEGDGPRLAMIGKGLTFDSGGLSLKAAAKMHEMKFDMCGGAAVIEAIGAIAELGVPARVLGLIGAAENLPSGGALKPGDVVRALDGTTIEINNTDAEGRLVLADCMCYARQHGCDRMVDVATLTGGMVTALGSTYAGLMANDDDLASALLTCGQRTGELLWRMPLHREYAEMVKGRYADLTNRTERLEATPLTAAELLHHFAGEVPWAHLDIAGTAYDVPRSYFDKGATGFGVRLLVELARMLGSGRGGAGEAPAWGV